MRLHLVSHTHWDREWFLPSRYTREWLPPFFEALFALLERRPEYRFTLDGQTILIEDYFDQLELDRRSATVPANRRVRDPEAARRLLQRHVQAGRIAVGPYYLQPDWNLVSGEALVRNLQIGRRDALEFGKPMKAGWILDNFGQIGQCPQIHCGFGLFDLVFWRGLDLAPEKVQTELIWESPDGSAVTAVYMIDSYRNAMQLLAHPEILIERLRYAAERGARFSAGGQVLLMNGYDQEMDPEDVLPALEHARAEGFDIRQVRPEEFFSAVRSALGRPMHGRPGVRAGSGSGTPSTGDPDTCGASAGPEGAKATSAGNAPAGSAGAGDASADPPTICGEQYNGRYISVFPGVLSARVYLKQANHRAETLLERYLEPIAAQAALQGLPFPEPELSELWRELLRNHPHDSICGVSVDDVHTDMEARYARIGAGADALLRRCLDRTFSALTATRSDLDASEQISGNTDPLHTVFNPLPESRSEVVILNPPSDHTSELLPSATELNGSPIACSRLVTGELALLLERIPPTGFKSFTVTAGATKAAGATGAAGAAEAPGSSGGTSNRPATRAERRAESVVLENAHLRAMVHPNGTVDLRDNENGAEYRELLCFESSGDLGDTYSYCGPSEDKRVLSADDQGTRLEVVESGPVLARCRITQELRLPAAANETRTGRSAATIAVPVVSELSLSATDTALQVRVQLRNRARDHRLRVLFPVSGERVAAGSPYDTVERPAVPRSYHDDEIPAHLKEMLLGAREPAPITTLPFRSFVAAEGADRGLAVLTRGLYEYEYVPASVPGSGSHHDSGTLALTLLRSVGWLARGDLTSRTGDAGPLIATPDAQCLRDLVFEFALLPYEGTWQTAGVPAEADRFAAPPLVAAFPPADADPPDQAETDSSVPEPSRNRASSLIELRSANNAVRLSALTLSENQTAITVRLHNPSPSATEAALIAGFRVSAAAQANLAEDSEQLLSIHDNTLALEIGGHEIMTLLLYPETRPAVSRASDQPNASERRPNLEIAGVLPLTEPLEPAPNTATAGIFSRHQPVPIVDEDQLTAERERLADLRNALADRQAELGTARRESKTDRKLDLQIQRLEAAVSTTERTLLEAEISVQMMELKARQQATGTRRPDSHDRQSRELFRRIGYRLNQARIKKRTDDYLCDLLEREAEHGGA